ncbi:sialic acid TRAP transporter substrate-binding protein SiaP [Paenibacillus alkalitolerans]|uniref:sialic acid TRAP transporter substrate-binding protein SiaP n=1 Tax=Paenibacillus alkalitolerans TaxID=2799335 RepID=UPI0018F38E90|nr:sialic acid TRAP transporter substrate-binding protein SiaP [Paenibacillus alkalitolerans]
MGKKGLQILGGVIIAALVLAGCGGSPGKVNNDAGQQPAAGTDTKEDTGKTFTLKFSTQSVPNDAHTKALEVLKSEVEKSTDGQVKIEIHHSGSLFNQDNEGKALQRGNLDMAYTSAPWLSEQVPYLSMFTAGYVFKDYDHMTKVLNGEIGKKVFDDVAAATGMRPLGAFYLGSRQLNYKDIGRDIMKPEDLKGVKLRMPNTPSWLFLGKSLGGNPTPVAFSELYMALSSGTVDAQDNPLPTVLNAKFYEVAKNISLTGHVVDSVWPTINEKVWEEMGPDLQSKMLEAVEKARQFCDETNLEAEGKLVDQFKAEGINVVTPDVEAFRTHVQKQYLENEEMVSTWDMDLYKKVQDMAK